MRSVWLVGLGFGLALSTAAQALQKKTDAEIKAEDAQAESLYKQQKLIDAVPLFEDLHQQVPQSLVYDERLGMALLGRAATEPDAEALATRKRARALLLQAKAAGDNSNLLTIMLEQLSDLDKAPAKTAPAAGSESFKKAEAAFVKGDLPLALQNYQKAYEENPQYYSAALFAGDTEFKLGHPKEAGIWFGRAVAINPDIETAYRYWGDCLEKAGEHKEAESKFIEAIIADPYTRAPHVGLKQWADTNHAMLVAPPIKLPAAPTAGGKPGDMTITLDPTADSGAMMRGILYTGTRMTWQKDDFKKHFPNEKTYRHSLPEEAAAIRSMLAAEDIQKDKKKEKDSKNDPSIELLTAIEKDGMLECWILFDNPDQGIAQDYIAYRKEHRDLMHRYIEKYEIHAM